MNEWQRRLGKTGEGSSSSQSFLADKGKRRLVKIVKGCEIRKARNCGVLGRRCTCECCRVPESRQQELATVNALSIVASS
jgi:hypothetical protein